MKKKQFIDSVLVWQITWEVLSNIREEKKITIEEIAKMVWHSWPYIQYSLKWNKGNYTLFEKISEALWKSKSWYRQLNIDICEYVLNYDKETFIQKFWEKRYNESSIKDIM